VLRLGPPSSAYPPARLITTIPSGGTGPRGIAITRAGQVYVAHYDGGTGPGLISAFSLSRAGRLRPRGSSVATGSNGAEAITADASGQHLYVANFNTGGPGSISAFILPPTQPPQLLAPPVPTGGQEPDFGGIVLSTG
jgi:DNA-binding beta-propeller fold protein YncE